MADQILYLPCAQEDSLFFDGHGQPVVLVEDLSDNSVSMVRLVDIQEPIDGVTQRYVKLAVVPEYTPSFLAPVLYGVALAAIVLLLWAALLFAGYRLWLWCHSDADGLRTILKLLGTLLLCFWLAVITTRRGADERPGSAL